MPVITYATRKSQLALAQCRALVGVLGAAHADVRFVELLVTTTGDLIQDRPLSEVGGKGLFVKEIEEALLAGRADMAVHSVKDVPAELPPGLVLACIPERADPRDVLVAPRHGTLADLPSGARVGTSSLRRKMCIEGVRGDLVFVPIRGNVDTRLRKVDAGEVDAIVLAAAGLARLGLAGRVTEWLDRDVSLPAIGQGALGVEIRADDDACRALVSRLHHAETAIAVSAERGVLAALDGDCRTPIAAHATRDGQELELRVRVADKDGSRVRLCSRRAPWPDHEADARAFGLDVGGALR